MRTESQKYGYLDQDESSRAYFPHELVFTLFIKKRGGSFLIG